MSELADLIRSQVMANQEVYQAGYKAGYLAAIEDARKINEHAFRALAETAPAADQKVPASGAA